MTAKIILSDLKKLGSKKKAEASSWFFKTGKGEYGEGDVFIGVTVPEIRSLAKEYKFLSMQEIRTLLSSNFHEARLIGVIILVHQFEKSKGAGKEAIVRFYLDNANFINNWDIVDLSVYKILGAYLFERDRKLLYQLAKSENIWKRRMSIVATYYFIKKKDLEDTFKISKMLLSDKEDLIHKAVGWMLREAGKVNQKELINFLEANYANFPRTALRYAIEKFPEKQRKAMLLGFFKK